MLDVHLRLQILTAPLKEALQPLLHLSSPTPSTGTTVCLETVWVFVLNGVRIAPFATVQRASYFTQWRNLSCQCFDFCEEWYDACQECEEEETCDPCQQEEEADEGCATGNCPSINGFQISLGEKGGRLFSFCDGQVQDNWFVGYVVDL